VELELANVFFAPSEQKIKPMPVSIVLQDSLPMKTLLDVNLVLQMPGPQLDLQNALLVLQDQNPLELDVNCARLEHFHLTDVLAKTVL